MFYNFLKLDKFTQVSNVIREAYERIFVFFMQKIKWKTFAEDNEQIVCEEVAR